MAFQHDHGLCLIDLRQRQDTLEHLGEFTIVDRHGVLRRKLALAMNDVTRLIPFYQNAKKAGE